VRRAATGREARQNQDPGTHVVTMRSGVAAHQFGR
jgi:hypothetical protein